MSDVLFRALESKNKKDIETHTTQLADIATNVKNYWVNGYANWTPAFAAAFEYLQSVGGGTVLVPEGVYEAIVKIPNYCGVVGTGAKSIIKLPANSTEACIQLYDINTICVAIKDITIDGNKANQTLTNAKGIYLLGDTVGRLDHTDFYGLDGNDTIIQNVIVTDCYGYGVHLDCRGVIYTNWLVIRTGNSDGLYCQTFDGQFNNITSGENYGNGFVIAGGNNRFVNCKSWNNGIGNTAKTSGYGFYLNGCDQVYVQGETQGNLLDGVYLSSTRMSTIDVFSDANGKRDSIISNGVSGFVLNNSIYNLIRGSVRNRKDRGETYANYAVSLLGTCSDNIIDVTALDMAIGALYDAGTNFPSNLIKIRGNDSNNNKFEATTSLKTVTTNLSSCTTWSQVNDRIPDKSVVVVEPQQIVNLLPNNALTWGTVTISKFSGGRISAVLSSNNGGVIGYIGTLNNSTGSMEWKLITAPEGKATISGDGTYKATINHGLGVVPSFVSAQAGNSVASTAQITFVSADATVINVYFTNAMPVGTNNIVLYWRAKP